MTTIERSSVASITMSIEQWRSEVVGQHKVKNLLVPRMPQSLWNEKQRNDAIQASIDDQLKGTSVTVVHLGETMHAESW